MEIKQANQMDTKELKEMEESLKYLKKFLRNSTTAYLHKTKWCIEPEEKEALKIVINLFKFQIDD